MMTFLAAYVVTVPSAAVTSTRLPGFNVPAPRAHVTLFFLNRNSTPFVFAPTTSFLRFIICARSTVTFSITTPCSAASCRANSKCSLLVSSALDGMQPTLTQVPPSVLSSSTQTVFRPSCAARMDATYPPGPPPMTTTSAAIVSVATRQSTSMLAGSSINSLIRTRKSTAC